MGRKVFRYRFDHRQGLIIVRAEGQSRSGGYYALGKRAVDCRGLSKSAANDCVRGAVEDLAETAANVS